MAQPINVQHDVQKHQGHASPIHIKPSHEGALHKELHVKEGDKIPESDLKSKLAAAKKEHNVKLEKRIVFAENFGHKK